MRSCKYSALEDMIIWDQIMIGVLDDATRRKILQIRKLDLNTTIDVCQANEVVTQQLKSLCRWARTSIDSTSHRGAQRRRAPGGGGDDGMMTKQTFADASTIAEGMSQRRRRAQRTARIARNVVRRSILRSFARLRALPEAEMRSIE